MEELRCYARTEADILRQSTAAPTATLSPARPLST